VYKKFDDIEPRFVVGDRARLGRFCQFSIVGNTIIEEDAGISDCVLIADTSHDYTDPSAPWFRQEMHRPKPVVVGAGAAIGYGAILLPGVRIGPHAYVGENSVVGEDVPRGAVVAGNPARVVPAREGAAKRRP
jgi:maltose O-acetyltransferase